MRRRVRRHAGQKARFGGPFPLCAAPDSRSSRRAGSLKRATPTSDRPGPLAAAGRERSRNTPHPTSRALDITRNLPARTLPALALALALGLSLAAADPAFGAASATKGEAVAMVKKGIAFIKAQGVKKGYAAISDKAGPFIDRDLYLVVYGLDGKCLAHGANPKQIGRDLIDPTDVDGKYFVKERVTLAKSKPAGFWQDYKFTNPVSKKVEPKVMYCEKLGEAAVCGGVYP